jgi:cystathionine beta-lyase/cystathionine gamma-synthase
MLFFETLSNPLLKAIPLVELGELARENRLLLVVDNTFLTPILARPRLAGAHIVLHSCTKYMNGHSDLIAGVASGSRKYLDRVWAQMLKTGGHLDPAACLQLERGLKTLSLRMERHVFNADTLARHFAEHPEIAHVYHPSLSSYAYPWVRSYCPKGFGGMLAFEVKGGDERALRFIDHLQIPKVATSLGGVESLISLPFNTSHSVLTQRQRTSMGIRPGLVRLSVGIEDVDDLKKDFDRALEASRATEARE